eukprot:31545-Pelagococcus_subviridis.AAC.1
MDEHLVSSSFSSPAALPFFSSSSRPRRNERLSLSLSSRQLFFHRVARHRLRRGRGRGRVAVLLVLVLDAKLHRFLHGVVHGSAEELVERDLIVPGVVVLAQRVRVFEQVDALPARLTAVPAVLHEPLVALAPPLLFRARVRRAAVVRRDSLIVAVQSGFAPGPARESRFGRRATEPT